MTGNRFVLTGGLVIDGTGAPARTADVVVSGGRVVDVADPRTPGQLGVRVDVTGLCVAPGFIDMHAHSDLAVLSDPQHLAKTLQGVTLEVLGQDGLSYVPSSDATLAELRAQLHGWNADPANLDWDFRSIGAYLDRVDQGSPVNVAYLVPHGSVRMLVRGAEAGLATAQEIAAMCALVDQGMSEGAIGMSTGLTYTPATYADERELIALCAVVARRGGFYAPHHRNYGLHFLGAVDECIAIARASGVPLHLTHCHMSSPVNKGRHPELIDRLDRALAAGLDVTVDSYPYVAGSSYLHCLLPGWVQAGGLAATRARLCHQETRDRVIHELNYEGTDGNHGLPVDWDTIVIAGVEQECHRAAVGRPLSTYAAQLGQSPAQVYLDIVNAEDFKASCIVMAGNEENVVAIMQHPVHMAGSDGLLTGLRPHPRGWGTFARYLGRYARELGVLSMEGAVARMTGRPARRLGLQDRGLIRPGYIADLVAFDPLRVSDRATYDNPKMSPIGVEHVYIAGQAVVSSGSRTTLLPGRAIRGSAGH